VGICGRPRDYWAFLADGAVEAGREQFEVNFIGPLRMARLRADLGEERRRRDQQRAFCCKLDERSGVPGRILFTAESPSCWGVSCATAGSTWRSAQGASLARFLLPLVLSPLGETIHGNRAA